MFAINGVMRLIYTGVRFSDGNNIICLINTKPILYIVNENLNTQQGNLSMTSLISLINYLKKKVLTACIRVHTFTLPYKIIFLCQNIIQPTPLHSFKKKMATMAIIMHIQ